MQHQGWDHGTHPCPKCSSSRTWIARSPIKPVWYVRCFDCKYFLDNFRTREAAELEWSKKEKDKT